MPSVNSPGECEGLHIDQSVTLEESVDRIAWAGVMRRVTALVTRRRRRVAALLSAGSELRRVKGHRTMPALARGLESPMRDREAGNGRGDVVPGIRGFALGGR